MQFLLTLPPGMAREFAALEGKSPPAWFATSDPAGSKLGSGGGTANLLAEACGVPPGRTSRLSNGSMPAAS